MVIKQRLMRIAKTNHLGESIGCLLFVGLFRLANALPQETLESRWAKFKAICRIKSLILIFSEKEVDKGRLNCYQRDSLISCQLYLPEDYQIKKKLKLHEHKEPTAAAYTGQP